MIVGDVVNSGHDPSSGLDDGSSESAHPFINEGSGTTATCGADPLSDVLETIRLRGALFFVWEPYWNYLEDVPHGDRLGDLILPGSERIVSYHIIAEGPCWAAISGEEPIRLETGDILLIPHGDAYAMSNRPECPVTPDNTDGLEFFRQMGSGDLPPVVVSGGDGPRHNRVICGFLGCERYVFNPVLDTLPPLVRIPSPGQVEDPLGSLIDFALSESCQHRGGERCLLMRLSEVMFVEVLRRYLRTAPVGSDGWLPGLRDPLVGRALDLLHRRMAEPWTLEILASELATSRSTLAERFANLVQEPPMQYLTRWRMQAAARRLSDNPGKIYAVAREVGYESEAAFSRAFKRVVGVSPAKWRDEVGRGHTARS